LIWILFSIGVKTESGGSRSKFGSIKNVVSKKENWYIWVFNWVNFGLFYVIQTVIGKKYLEDFAGYSSSRAAVIFSITGVIAAFSGIIQAYLSSLCNDRKAVFCRGAVFVSLLVFCGQILMLVSGKNRK
jgi:hypothetical protein